MKLYENATRSGRVRQPEVPDGDVDRVSVDVIRRNADGHTRLLDAPPRRLTEFNVRRRNNYVGPCLFALKRFENVVIVRNNIYVPI